MNSQPGVNEILALLETLKSSAAEFAGREAALEKNHRARTAAAQNLITSDSQAQESAAATAEFNAANALETEKNLLQARFEKRHDRINRVHAATGQRVASAIEKSDAEWRDRTQQGVQAAEIHRDEELANAMSAHENFQKNLAAAGDEQARLETAARSAFRGYGRFRRLLARGKKWPELDLSADEIALFSRLQTTQAKITADLGRFREIYPAQDFQIYSHLAGGHTAVRRGGGGSGNGPFWPGSDFSP